LVVNGSEALHEQKIRSRHSRIPAGGRMENKTMIRVLVVDDHQVVRRGLKQVLGEETDMEVVREASNASELLDMMSECVWDVVVLDIGLPDQSGLEVLKEIKAMCPEMPVLILSMHSEGQYVVKALQEGASGYVTKESAAEEVVVAIRQIISGRKYVSPSLVDRLSRE
jgi:two-component system, NarL family, invasion response regulator UvrY